MNLNDDSKKIISLLLGGGYQAYAVGGCVRDCIIGREVGDVDITTSAKPWEVEVLLDENDIMYIETGLKHGTITAVINHTPYEITTFRTDGEYLDNRHPEEVVFVNNLSDDLARRDFTMNAIAYNEKEGIVDVYGGEEDIKNQLIRAVGDPDKRFNEDALRILRALRFAAVLGFDIEENTKKAIFANRLLLKNIAGERIFAELKKLVLGDFCEQVLLEYRTVLAVVMPEIEASFDYPQNSVWHIYDVYTHIVKSVAVSPKKDYIRFAVLLHDIGKPFTKTTDEFGQDHFKGHPTISADLAEKILKRLKVSNDFYNKTITLIKIHDMHITTKPSNIKKWLRKLGEDFIFDFIDVKIADLTTHNLDLSGEEIETLKYIKKLTADIIESGEPYQISDLKINGNDLKAIGFEGRSIQHEFENLINIVSGNPKCNTREKLLHQANLDFKNR